MTVRGQITAIASADFDGDGHADIAVTTMLCDQGGCSDGKLWIVSGPGQGDFGDPVFYPSGIFPHAISTTDLDGDGYTDIAIAHGYSSGGPCGGGVVVYLNDGLGGFESAEFYGGGYSGFVVSGDFNEDGAPDLALNYGSVNSGIRIRLNDGTGTLGPPEDFPVGGPSLLTGFRAADFSGDGHVDLVVTKTRISQAPPSDLFLLQGDGQGGFTVTDSFFLLGRLYSPEQLVTSDLNEDSHCDLAIVQR